MGGRGAFVSSMGRTDGIPLSNREYSCIGYLGKIKVIQCDTKSNNPTPTYSNTANTTYFSYSKENMRIEHIYYYRNHRLVKSVDFKVGEVPHSHYWSCVVVGRKKHSSRNTHPLSSKDQRLLKLAKDFNKQRS